MVIELVGVVCGVRRRGGRYEWRETVVKLNSPTAVAGFGTNGARWPDNSSKKNRIRLSVINPSADAGSGEESVLLDTEKRCI